MAYGYHVLDVFFRGKTAWVSASLQRLPHSADPVALLERWLPTGSVALFVVDVC